MRRTIHRRGALVALGIHTGPDGSTRTIPITWADIRRFVDNFTGYAPMTGTAELGPVWCAVGSTARLGMIDALVLQIVAGPMVADVCFFPADQIRKIRRATHAECEAQGFGVHDGEPFEPYFGEASE